MEYRNLRTDFEYINDPMGFTMPYPNAGKLDIKNMRAKYDGLEDKSKGLCKRLTGVVYGGLRSRRAT